MNREIVINEAYTSIIETCDDIFSLNLDTYNEKEKGLISFFPRVRRRTLRTKDFCSGLSDKFKSEDIILPSGCKFYKRIGPDNKLVIIEEPPRIRTIFVDTGIEQILEKLRLTGKLKQYGLENYKPTTREGGGYAFQLSFPFVVFIITLNNNNHLRSIFPFFRLHPITSLTDYLFLAPLYNIPQNQGMCIGSVTNEKSLDGSVSNIIEKFWSNIYNHDYSYNIGKYQATDQYEVHDYLSWMYFTQIDPMFIYSIKWIVYEKNLGRMIRDFSRSDESSSEHSFKQIYNIAKDEISTDIERDQGVINVALSLPIKNDTITIGDEFLYEEKRMYLYSIVGDNESIISVELEDEDGIIIDVPMMDFEKGYDTIFKPNSLTEALVNDVVIKNDDVISFNIDGITMYKKIKGLRQSRDGHIEAYIGSDHYLIENLDFKIVDVSNVTINGQVLTAGKLYSLLLKRTDSYGPLYSILKVVFKYININNKGQVIIVFEDKHGYETNINYESYKKGDSGYEFIEDIDYGKNEIMYYFDKLLSTKHLKSNNLEFLIVKNRGIAFTEGNIRDFIVDSVRSSSPIIAKQVLFDDDKRLFIPGISSDIEFKVGDPIVYFNWRNPEDMLYVAGIDEFILKEEIIYIKATTIDKKQTFEIPMVDCNIGRVNVGAVRKVFSKCRTWSSGDKIKANVAGLTNFPKKDVNTIIAFIDIPDAKYPVALCSNLCTLWMRDETICNFHHFPVNSAKWNKLENTPWDTSKIKWQHGDIFRSNNSATRLSQSTHFLNKKYGTIYGFDSSYLTSWGQIDYGNYISKNSLEKDKIRHGIIMPRFPSASPRAADVRKGYLNMLGGYVLNSASSFSYRSDQFLEDF